MVVIRGRREAEDSAHADGATAGCEDGGCSRAPLVTAIFGLFSRRRKETANLSKFLLPRHDSKRLAPLEMLQGKCWPRGLVK